MRCDSDSCCRSVPTALVVALIGVCAAGLVTWYVRQLPTVPVGPRPVEIIVSGDTAGWIVPCGCTANQSGGLPRRGEFIEAQRGRATVIYADAGGAPAGTSDYHRAKFEAILRGEMLMNVFAHNIGGPEAALGADYLRRIRDSMQVPLISANVRDSAGLVGWPIRTAYSPGLSVGFVGVLSRRYAAPGLTIDDPRDAVLAAASKYKKSLNCLVVLAYMPEDELRALAASLPEADAVIGGPTGQAIAPESVGPTTLAAATNKGKFVIRLQSAADRWSGSVVELDKSFADDRGQIANVNQYLAELARRDFAAADTGFAPTLPPGLPASYRIAGSESCKTCHQSDCQSWASSKHAHAWDTLAAKGYQVDGYCQQCHTTGFGLPDGFESANRSPDRRGVGCESCHGPSEGHVKDPKARTPFAGRDQCVRCHDHENSPTFAYEPYWEKVRHGK
jgi:hypothetical protein